LGNTAHPVRADAGFAEYLEFGNNIVVGQGIA
jgi:hypothetical protein